MSIQIQTPNITAGSDREKLQQIQSYLYRMAQQLQWAFDTVQAGGSHAVSAATAPQKKTQEKEDPAETFAGLKNLIIKSADIVNAYYDQINRRLGSVYVAQSDFGTYSELTDQQIQENAKGVEQLFLNEQTIIGRVGVVESGTQRATERLDELALDMRTVETNLSGLMAQALVTNAYIKSGLLDYDGSGLPIYGLEIGQTNNVNGVEVFDKFARFSSDRLSFFDQNDTEVAYVSDYKLYITNAEITGTLRLSGKFKIYYNNGLAFQWVGGGV